MNITLFIEPKSLKVMVEVLQILNNLPLENDYTFQPKDLIFSEKFHSEYVWLNIPVGQYYKLKYSINKMNKS